MRFWSLIELLSLIKSTLGLFLFPLTFGSLDCGGAFPGFGASPGLSLRFWSLIELLSLIKSMLGFFLFPLGLGAWTAEGLLLVLGLLLVSH